MVKVHNIRKSAPAPALTWVPVAGPDGHVRMEMRWHVAAQPSAATAVASQPHAA